MTQSKAYNLKVYCDLKKIDIEAEEAKEFLCMTFYEQLTVIKGLRPSIIKQAEEEVGDEDNIINYSIIDRIFKK